MGRYLLVGNGQIGTHPIQTVGQLPENTQIPSATSPATEPVATSTTSAQSTDAHGASVIGIIIGVGIGCLALLAMGGVILGLIRNRKGRTLKDGEGGTTLSLIQRALAQGAVDMPITLVRRRFYLATS